MDNQGNILKLSFLMSYLALLICVVVGIPFMTCVFRSIILMFVFAMIGYSFRWFLLHVVSSVEPEERASTLVDSDEDLGEFSLGEEETGAGEPEQNIEATAETVDQDMGQS